MLGKSTYSDKLLADSSVKALRERLPRGWSAKLACVSDRRGAEAILEIRCPAGTRARLAIEARSSLFPREIAEFIRRRPRPVPAMLFVAPFLSPSTRRRLQDLDQNYLDLTGNIRVVVSKPGLYVEAPGADKDPAPAAKPTRSLKGAKSGRLVRALCDLPPPLSLSELSSKAGVDIGYASRLLEWLSREALVTRAKRGPVQAVDRGGLIKRWADDYAVLRSNSARSYLDPRGISTLGDRLGGAGFRYAVTGSLAANKTAPVAPTRLAMIYVTNPDEAAAALKLKATEAGANVMLLVPFDEVVFERTWERDGLTLVALSQLAVDLLTSPGRGPSEAESILPLMASPAGA